MKRVNRAIWLLVMLVLLLVLVVQGFPGSTSAREIIIPKRIYTFWHERPSGIILQFIRNWEHYCKGYQIIVLDPSNYVDHIDNRPTFNMSALKIQHQADWIRIAVLQENGGFWMDASVLLTDSLDRVQETVSKMGGEGFAYNVASPTRGYPILDNFFIASVPKGQFVTAWLLEYTLALKSDYVADLKNNYEPLVFESLTSEIQDLEYFKMNLAGQKVLQINKIPSLATESAFETPFRLFMANDRDPALTAKAIVTCSLINDRNMKGCESLWPVPFMIKLTSAVREQLIAILDETPFAVQENSVYSRYLNL
jgi:hypothetical protein